MAGIGESDYRAGARERLADAYLLLRQDRLGGSVYLAGRAVEGMLRAVIWKSDPDYATGRKTLDTGHTLRDVLRVIRNLGAFRDTGLWESLAADVQKVGRLWWNNTRFLATAKIQTAWYRLNEVGGRRTMKQAATEYYDACSAILKRCETLWQSRRE